MTRRNIASSLGKRRAPPMHRFDRLPPDLRQWLAQAALPWSVKSAERIWAQEMRRSGCAQAALARLNRAEASALRKDAPQIWGAARP